MSRDKLLQATDNNCIEKKTITFFLFSKWHRTDELAAAKIIFGLKKLSLVITPRFYLQMANRQK